MASWNLNVHVRAAAAAVLALLIGSGVGCASRTTTFATPEEGAKALVAAMHPVDQPRLRAMLGPESDDLVFSGDEVADQHAADEFVAKYQQRHGIVIEDDAATLVVGADEWPMPIPLVRDGKGWRFDTEAGKDEILARRIGRNELSTIQTCRAIVDAQQEYATMAERAGRREFAAQFRSDPGKHNGLFWPTKEGEPPSPLGPLVAEAVTEGYAPRDPAQAAGPRPYNGYLYRILTAQGPWAPGGARSYLTDGRLTEGFAVVAWPVEYGNSGIKTFMVRHDGIVYEQDLGEETAALASQMTEFNPGQGWELSP